MPDDRPVLIGIAPARPGEEGQPLNGLAAASTGRKLAEMCGLRWIDYNRRFARVNVCPAPQPGGIHSREYERHAENLAASLLIGRRVVLLGSNVASCFGIRRGTYEYLEWHLPPKREFAVGWRVGSSPPFLWAVLPHPSGRNRWYNDDVNKENAREFMRGLLNDT